MGYRRIRDELDGHKGIHVNDKRVLRICRKYDIKSNIKWKPKSCTRGDRNPDHIAKNYLHREFHAEKPNEKWLTDVSEFKYYNGIEVHKVYLSAILDLYDRRIVSFKISDHNDNPLVMDTFDEAVRQEPDAHPLVHSDRGFQYTSAQFYTRLKKHHMKQSMSRVAHCIDNGPMEGFWGILKREMYYKQRFNDRSVLEEGYRDVEIGGCKVRIGGMYEYAFALDGDNSAENLTGNVRDFLEEFQNTDRYKIMLCHRPDSFVFGDASDYWKIDLVISGHDHGGQVVIPFKGGLYGGDQGWFPPYVHGLYRTGRIRLFVTSGLSSEKQKLPRWNNRPEIAVLNVH